MRGKTNWLAIISFICWMLPEEVANIKTSLRIFSRHWIQRAWNHLLFLRKCVSPKYCLCPCVKKMRWNLNKFYSEITSFKAIEWAPYFLHISRTTKFSVPRTKHCENTPMWFALAYSYSVFQHWCTEVHLKILFCILQLKLVNESMRLQ